MERKPKRARWVYWVVDSILGGVLVACLTALVLGLVVLYWVEG
jgi:hypothetical protein